ncbi:exopolysaccharide biosynthesis polyprenyl glycosylphosphotransferase [Streptomyces sp. 8N616]|uniref:exopolysaccharide biosynthesis polyprenyl glycosylphosphotransferase n=1 Tax=Streptomyces sp. 8N616 TaxID=3457414 RepID=UPI003FD0077B
MTTENAGVPSPGRVVSLLGDTTRPASPVFAPLRPFRGPAPAGQRNAPLVGRLGAALAAADCLAAVAAAVLLGEAGRAAAALGPSLAVQLVLGARGGLYRPGPMTTALDELPRLLGHSAVAWCAATAVLAGIRPPAAPGWSLLLGVVAVNVVLVCLGRAALHAVRRRRRRRRPHSTLVVGGDPAGRRVAAALHEHPEYGMCLVGLVSRAPGTGTGPATAPEHDPAADRDPAGDPDLDGELERELGRELDRELDSELDRELDRGLDRELDRGLERELDAAPPGVPELPVPVLVAHEDIARAVIQNAVQDAVFTRSPWDDPQDAALVRLFAELGCALWLVHGEPAADAGPRRPGGPDHIWGFACLRLDSPPRHRLAILGKRILDIAVATVALLLSAPVMLACAIAVRWSDGPGVIFRQERIGMAGRPFTVLKFRTLRPADEHESATRWNVADDERMSGVGHLLRRTSLDELPQLWNVLRGDMSLVGPRPERPYFVGKFSATHPGYAARHRMPVGITGLAQIHGLRGDTSIEDRARFDNHYIETWSLWQDVRILLRTAGSLIRSGGS